MSKFYIAVTIQDDRNKNVFGERTHREPNPGYYSYIIPCSESDNLKTRLENIGGLLHANICSTKKRASEIVAAWNTAYKKNGTYLFDGSF